MVEVRETMWWLKPAEEPPIWVNSFSWLSKLDETQPIGMAEERVKSRRKSVWKRRVSEEDKGDEREREREIQGEDFLKRQVLITNK